MKTLRYNDMTDAQILEQFYITKDKHWVGILLERYTLLLLGLCMKYVKDEEDAKDCVQQIFLKVLTEVAKYRIEYFKSWLYMVAKNQCLMKLREKGHKEMKQLSENHLSIKETDRNELMEHEAAYDLLAESIGELNEEQRLCVTLFYLQKASYAQISEKTGFSMLQVKSYIQNGKRNLKLMLEKKLKAKKAK